MPEHTPAPTPSRAIYGFAMFLSFKMLFILYLTWAVIPEQWFVDLGITYLPQRYWAVAIPVFLLTALTMFAFVLYPTMGLFMTPDIDDLRTIRDDFGVKKSDGICTSSQEKIAIKGECSCVNKAKCYRDQYERNCGDFVNRSIPVLRDLDILEVSEHLYADKNE